MGERADAVRNREAILVAAKCLIDERGLEAICMDDVAVAAGVGKGTVFRRFGDREGLVEALALKAGEGWRERAALILEDEDKSAAERVILFARELFDHVVETLPLVRAFEQVSRSYACGGGMEPIRDGLIGLVERLHPGGDAEFRAESLLVNLRAAHIHYLVHQRGMPVERVRAGVMGLAEDLVAPGAS
ncbi:helix-turn-helix domain-containing protein [Umezawaea sp. Da 62-37]|uniref:TetR/AcrR family transcriptional regulator n=1 Tax=Umezawaea sp. Da 62-37 TaxID=3075927 RepID=UPI0028F6E567|nr:helix-turn-helix domain-containing protein [Umezawaea sp. Da 62-37]WNV89817.1 helix-turn-helix domain-containing protein [Umezawaea sp. Da 62-37]